MKRVLMVSSEAVPYIKTGGLADVCSSLPKFISKSYKDVDVRVILPLYGSIKEEFRKERVLYKTLEKYC